MSPAAYVGRCTGASVMPLTSHVIWLGTWMTCSLLDLSGSRFHGFLFLALFLITAQKFRTCPAHSWV